jgi:hypothetical protein
MTMLVAPLQPDFIDDPSGENSEAKKKKESRRKRS